MPGKKEVSVHVTDLPQLPAIGIDVQAWDRLLVLRNMVSKVLERARGAGQIGQSLEADVVLHGNFSPKTLTGDLDVDLAKFFIVSHVDFRPPDEVVGDVVDIPGVGTIAVTMAPARGKKCGRCWSYREEVVEDGGLCARCEDVVAGLAPPEAATV
jgi:isoleucyl-tRNA synthetase